MKFSTHLLIGHVESIIKAKAVKKSKFQCFLLLPKIKKLIIIYNFILKWYNFNKEIFIKS